MDINRTEVSRALAKALAYKQGGNHMQAEAWAIRLIELLECGGVLDSHVVACRRTLQSEAWRG